jgi:hypothetical protein
MNKAVLIILCAIIVWACNPVAETRQEQALANQYFSVDSLLDEQQKTLEVGNFIWIKQADFEGETNIDTLTVDSVRLARELQILRELDLNEPSLRDKYTVKQEGTAQTGILTYTATVPGKIGINFLKIYTEADRVVKLQGLYSQKNYLYTSERLITSIFDKTGRVSSIKVDGKQKMLFRNPVNYSLYDKIITRP